MTNFGQKFICTFFYKAVILTVWTVSEMNCTFFQNILKKSALIYLDRDGRKHVRKFTNASQSFCPK